MWRISAFNSIGSENVEDVSHLNINMLGLPKGFKTQHFTSAVSLNLLTPILLNVTPGESPRNFELKQTFANGDYLTLTGLTC